MKIIYFFKNLKDHSKINTHSENIINSLKAMSLNYEDEIRFIFDLKSYLEATVQKLNKKRAVNIDVMAIVTKALRNANTKKLTVAIVIKIYKISSI